MAKSSTVTPLKILIVGNSNTGKSCLTLRFVDEQFTSSFVPTIGIDFHVKSVELSDGRKVKLQVGYCYQIFSVLFSTELLNETELGRMWTLTSCSSGILLARSAFTTSREHISGVLRPCYWSTTSPIATRSSGSQNGGTRSVAFYTRCDFGHAANKQKAE